MNIEFSKTISGKKALGEFVKQDEPVYQYFGVAGFKKFLIDFTYDLAGIEKKCLDELNAAFTKQDQSAMLHECSEECARESQRYTIKITEVRGDEGYGKRKILTTIIDDQETRAITLPKEGLIKTRNIPVLSYIPAVYIWGLVDYKQSHTVNPIPALQILMRLGYNVKVMLHKEFENDSDTMQAHLVLTNISAESQLRYSQGE